ncbi:MAG TPA: S41 family peptidase [Oligoflexus sp.]|uniref:S41 family peptidase n=1 Tax=Oligoflexus sp. TaxID=1971216 RepID=UPI002D7E5C55|nr:S41 family peptidase [Oligoflexus sp.]HET9240166.1 S41 family peptidase [Oligoflexus sp.]
MFKRNYPGFLTFLGMVLVTGAVSSPSIGVAKERLNHAKIVESLTREFKENYVFPDVAAKMESALKKNLADGRYKDIDDPEILANRLKVDLIEVSHDKHINVFYREKDPGDPETNPAVEAREVAAMASGNFGFKKLEILPGNIGYIDLRGFMPAEYGGPTAVAAMKYMANTRALIFDLRNNGGGSPSMIQLLTSYLVASPTHLNTFYVRKTNSEEQFWTAAHVEGPRYLDKEVYVLTSGGTFSAAEEFSYNLKNLKRATLVGETTGGGAHPVNLHYLKDIKFAAMIPFGRAINPITKTNWEGTGVEPDVKVKTEEALTKAHSLALENLLKKSKDADDKKRISWALDTVKAQRSPLTLKAETLKSYVGQYGDRVIALENEQLVYNRGTRKSRLIPLDNDRFAVDGLDHFRVQFNRDGQGNLVSLSGLYEDGKTDKSERSK